MKILSSIIVIFGLLVAIGGVFALIGHNPSGVIRIVVGLVIIGIAFAVRPKSTAKASTNDRR